MDAAPPEHDQPRAQTQLHNARWPVSFSGHLRRTGGLRISHETIYRHVWHDRRYGGDLYRHLRGASKLRRKRYQHHDSRGRLAGKRHISERPLAAEQRVCIGHWEIDTVIGHASKHCIVSLVDRKSGFLQIGKLNARTAAQTTQRTIDLINRQPAAFRTITADNGTEFHSYAQIERATRLKLGRMLISSSTGSRTQSQSQRLGEVLREHSTDPSEGELSD